MQNNSAHSSIAAAFMRNLFSILSHAGQKAYPHCPNINSHIEYISQCIGNPDTLNQISPEELSYYQSLVNQAFSDELNASDVDPNYWQQ